MNYGILYNQVTRWVVDQPVITRIVMFYAWADVHLNPFFKERQKSASEVSMDENHIRAIFGN
jgi:hypothetical protein